MATAVIMPKMGQAVESCFIAKWYKRPGEAVKAGELLFAFETDKAGFEVEAETTGFLLAVFFNEGEEVPVLANVAVIGQPGETGAGFEPPTISRPLRVHGAEQKEPGPPGRA